MTVRLNILGLFWVINIFLQEKQMIQ
jgi:hypothetical protein